MEYDICEWYGNGMVLRVGDEVGVVNVGSCDGKADGEFLKYCFLITSGHFHVLSEPKALKIPIAIFNKKFKDTMINFLKNRITHKANTYIYTI